MAMGAQRKGKEHEERDRAIKWVWMSVFAAVGTIVIGALLSIPLFWLLFGGFSEQAFTFVGQYFLAVIQKPAEIFRQYEYVYKLMQADQVGISGFIPMLPLVAGPVILFAGLLANPYSFLIQIHGTGRLANTGDIKAMNLFGGFVMAIGRWNGKMLMMPETLSCLCVAPPGTGKTVGVVIPTIFNSDKLSLIINDPKPELCYTTSGYRARCSTVFIINWGAEDDPDKGIYYPSWNALSPTNVPPQGPSRDLAIDAMVTVFVEEPKGNADPHWTKTGRLALIGLIQFILSKCERAAANDYFESRIANGELDAEDLEVLETYYMDMPGLDAKEAMKAIRAGTFTPDMYVQIGTWATLPEHWIGKESCVAMILDWMMEAQVEASEDIKRRMEEGDQMAALADPMTEVLNSAVQECRKYAYAQRAALELNQLASTPDKERGSILSTGLTGISIYKNAAVRARTSHSDFRLEDLRGMVHPETGEMQPVTVYLSINKVDARALNMISAIFVQCCSDFLIAHPPNKTSHNGIKCGPCSLIFVLDEFPEMPKLKAVIDGPAVGRGQKVSYLLIGQDLGQISGLYGKDELETVISTTAVKIILPQNNEQSAERFSKMIGNRTVEIKSSSRTEGYSKHANILSANISRQLQGVPVLTSADLLSLAKGKQVVLMQGFFDRPIVADVPLFYKDKQMLAASKLDAAPALPEYIRKARDFDPTEEDLGGEENADLMGVAPPADIIGPAGDSVPAAASAAPPRA